MDSIKQCIRSIPDYPKKGIVFRDITPLLSHPSLFKEAVHALMVPFQDKGIDVVVGIESRGFIFGSVLAYLMGASFVPVRKKGKLPFQKISHTYDLEYGSDTLEIHEDALQSGQKVLIVDDLLATGGTVCATARLVEKLGGKIEGIAFLIELGFLKGREGLDGYPVHSLIHYASEQD
jgi:adenine phosphoribosyltransferase